MKRILIPLCIASLAGTAGTHATPAAAERARMAYQLGVERWILETRLATTPEEREAAAANRPDPGQAARDVWQAISPELNRPWILPHAAWFIEMADSLAMVAPAGQPPPFGAELNRLLGAIREFHTKADEITPVCLALGRHDGPERLAILEQIREEHPEKSIRGVAALTQAIAMKSLGDEPAVIAKRLQLIRQAIIDSADVSIHGDTTVADVAEEELYIIRNLTSGRTAPDLSGMDSAGRSIKLSDHAGKVVILLFWSAEDSNAREVVEFTTAMQTRMRGRPVEILGVNLDPTATLRPLEADGTVSWKNLSDPARTLAREFRITNTPVCFVLDGKRVIRHTGPPGSFIEITALALLGKDPE